MSPAALAELEQKAEEVIDSAAIRGVVDSIYALDLTDWTDQSFAILEHLIDRLIGVLSAAPNQQHRVLLKRLFIAREGVEQGIAPDPAKRPSATEMRAFVSAHLV